MSDDLEPTLDDLMADAEAHAIDYDINKARIVYLAQCREQKLRVVLPLDNELLIDIDTDEQYAVFKRALEVWTRNRVGCGVGDDPPDVEVRPSRSGLPHRHIKVRLPFDVTPWQRIALQAAFGSDPVRELLSSVRLIRGDEHPTLLVEDGDDA